MDSHTFTDAGSTRASFIITLPSGPPSTGTSVIPYVLILGLILCLKSTRSRLQTTQHYEKPIWYGHKDPVLGLDALWTCAKGVYRHNFLGTVAGILARYGGTLSYLCLGKQAILTRDPENVRAILSDRFHDFGLGHERTSGLRPLLGGGIFNSDGEVWKHHRTTLRPFLSRVGATELDIIETHVQNLIRTIPSNGDTIDLQQSFTSFTIDAATQLFLGTSTNLLSLASAAKSEARQFAAAFDYAQRAVSGVDNYNIPRFIWRLVFGDSRLRRSISLIHSFIDELIDRAVHAPNSPSASGGLDTTSTTIARSNREEKAFIPALLANGRTREDVKYDILNITLAGKDTMASFLSSIWYVLSSRPDVAGKIRDEVSVFDGRRPTKEELGRLRYLHMVLQEVLRLYPPVALNQRTAVADTSLPRGGGRDGRSPIQVPRGTSVGYSVHAMHRIPEVFGGDADAFRPERWSEMVHPPPAFMPFHSGPRRCLGQQLALLWAKYCTVRLLQHFPHVEDRNEKPWEEKLGLNCSSRHGVRVAFLARDAATNSST